MKSGQWLNSLNNKNYSSDYILNKAAAAGININNIINSSNTNVNNNTDETIPNPKPQPQKQLPSIPNASNSNKRQLPKLNSIKQKSIDQENLSIESDKSSSINLNTNNKNVKNLSNSALSVPELAGDDTYSTNSNLEPNNKSNDTTNSNSNNNTNSINNNLLSRGSFRSNRSMKQPLIKQISLNNPPTYYQQLNDDDESTLYENLSKSPNKSFTSNHELRNAQYINDQYFSSPTSSISQLNTSLTSRTSISRRVERMQDPLLAFKNKTSNSRLNSATDLNAIDTDEAVLYNKEKSLNQINKKELSNLNNEIKKNSTTSLNKTETNNNISSANNQIGIVDKNNNNDSETNNENKKLNAINRNNLYPPLKQRAKELLHTDSLSSDPSDIQAASNQIMPTSQSEFNNKSANLDETGMQRKHSKTKRSTRQRKQPAIPINSSLALHQQKIFAKLNLKQQNSLTSSDENLNDDYDLVIQKDKKLRIGAQDIENINENEDASNELEQTDFLEDEEDENEDANNVDDDVDEEIRSTTEYTTNDEMDLESGSVSISANALANNNNNKNSSKTNRAGSNLQSSEFTSLDNNKNSIDDYLMQNLEKDEILAAKMSKFLSVSFFFN